MKDNKKKKNEKTPTKMNAYRGKLILSNLSDKYVELIKTDSFTLSGITNLDTFYSWFDPLISNENNLLSGKMNLPSDVSPTQWTASLFVNANFSKLNLRTLSFCDAFKAARDELGLGGFFEWRGNVYCTYMRTDWEALPMIEKNEFIDSIAKNAEYETLELKSMKVEIAEDGIQYTGFLDEEDHSDLEAGSSSISIEKIDASNIDELERTEESDDPRDTFVSPTTGLDVLHKSYIPEALDQDGDQNEFADVIIADIDLDEIPESIFTNMDDDADLDTIIIDEDSENPASSLNPVEIDEAVGMDNFLEISIDELIGNESDASSSENSEDDLDIDLGENDFNNFM